MGQKPAGRIYGVESLHASALGVAGFVIITLSVIALAHYESDINSQYNNIETASQGAVVYDSFAGKTAGVNTDGDGSPSVPDSTTASPPTSSSTNQTSRVQSSKVVGTSTPVNQSAPVTSPSTSTNAPSASPSPSPAAGPSTSQSQTPTPNPSPLVCVLRVCVL